jgi:acyl-CoA thioester hydrolase
MSERRWVFHHRLAVRFSDCDLLGHVNHAVYFTYFEQCRFEWWRNLGAGTGMPGAGAIIVHASCNYRAPSYVSDELEVRLAVAALGNSSVTLDYEIVNAASGQQVADGRTVNVAFDYASGRTIPLPPDTRALLSRVAEQA